MKSHTWWLAAAALAVALTACGADDSEEGVQLAPSEAPATTAVSPTTEPPVAAASTTTEAELPTTTLLPDETRPRRGAPVDADAVLAAFADTTEKSSGRMKGAIALSGVEGVGSVEIPFAGEFSANGDYAFRMDLTAAAALGDQELPADVAEMFSEIEVRQIGDIAYVRMPFLNAMLGVPVDWISAPADSDTDLVGSLGLMSPTSPTDLLDAFAGADASIEDLGPETVNDLPTTHYRVIVDAAALYEDASPAEKGALQSQGIPSGELPIDVWITADGVIARFVMEVDGSVAPSAPGQPFDGLLITYDLYDLGDDVVIEPPPADQVATSEELERLMSGAIGTPSA